MGSQGDLIGWTVGHKDGKIHGPRTNPCVEGEGSDAGGTWNVASVSSSVQTDRNGVNGPSSPFL